MLSLHAMAENFGLVSKSMRPKLGRKLTEILYIFFGIHTANVMQLADSESRNGADQSAASVK